MLARLSILALVTALIAALCAEKTYEFFPSGKPEPVKVKTAPGYLLAGGGDTPKQAYEWFVKKAVAGDALTLRASGKDAMNAVLMEAGPLNSASSVLFKSADASSDPFVIDRIRSAALIFLAGGDQWNYVRMWKGTPVNTAIDELVAKGVPIGGSSAGLAVLGEYSFSAEHDTVTSKEALADPFHNGVTIAEDFIHIPLLKGIITDTHFAKRDRMGRTLAFLARLLQAGKPSPVSSIAVDEGNAVLLEADGTATLSGSGSAYFMRAQTAPQQCQPGKPLTFHPVSVYRLGSSGRFNIRSWKGENGTAYELSVNDGVVTSTLAEGSLY